MAPFIRPILKIMTVTGMTSPGAIFREDENNELNQPRRIRET